MKVDYSYDEIGENYVHKGARDVLEFFMAVGVSRKELFGIFRVNTMERLEREMIGTYPAYGIYCILGSFKGRKSTRISNKYYELVRACGGVFPHSKRVATEPKVIIYSMEG